MPNVFCCSACFCWSIAVNAAWGPFTPPDPQADARCNPPRKVFIGLLRSSKMACILESISVVSAAPKGILPATFIPLSLPISTEAPILEPMFWVLSVTAAEGASASSSVYDSPGLFAILVSLKGY